jgi:ribosomal protein L7/L12
MASSYDPNRIDSAIHAIQETDRSMTFLEAHEFIRKLPKIFLTGVSKERARRAKKILSEGGVTVDIFLR